MTDPVILTGPSGAEAVQVAPRIWWVGATLAEDQFQNHAYLIEAGEHSVLVDPGSTLTIATTIDKVRSVIPLEQIRWLVVHHCDPDVADGLHLLDELLDPERVQIVTEWRSRPLLRHYGSRLETCEIEQLGWTLALDEGRRLEFVLTPYLHFPGAFVTWESSTSVLFSADLFGGFNRAGRLFATGPSDFEDLRQFHEHYMPSREILMTGLASIRAAVPEISMICPQHGYVIPAPFVDPMFEQLSRLECGIFLQSRRDAHLRELLEVASMVRRLEQVLIEVDEPAALRRAVVGELGAILPVRDVWVELLADEAEPGMSSTSALRLDADRSGFLVTRAPWTVADAMHLVIPVTLEDGRRSAVVIKLSESRSISSEIGALLAGLANAARGPVAKLVANYEAGLQMAALAEAAHRDPLTGTLNRRALDQRPARTEAVGLLALDLDHFKSINDRFGHAVGDRVLREVADAVWKTLRPDAQLYRVGGEEFVVIVPARKDDALEAIAERVRATVALLDLGDDLGGDRVTISVGGHLLPPDVALNEGLEIADQALYDAKQAGRNRVVLR